MFLSGPVGSHDAFVWLSVECWTADCFQWKRRSFSRREKLLGKVSLDLKTVQYSICNLKRPRPPSPFWKGGLARLVADLRGDRFAEIGEGRVQDLCCLQLRRTIDYAGYHLEHIVIRIARIGIGVFLVVPESDGKYVCAAGSGKRDFILESLLFAKHGNDFFLKDTVELAERVRLQMD